MKYNIRYNIYFSNYLPSANSRQISRDVKGDDPSTDAHKKLDSKRGEVEEKIEKEKKRERERKREGKKGWRKFPCFFLLDSFSLLGWSFDAVASRLRETQVREKKRGGGREDVKWRGKGRNTKHKKRILVDTSSSSLSSSRDVTIQCASSRGTILLPFLWKHSSSSVCVCVSTDRTTRDNSRSWSHTRSIDKFSPDKPVNCVEGGGRPKSTPFSFAQKRGVVSPEETK